MRPSNHSVYATGSWQAFPGQEEAFVAAWREFVGWAATLDGAGEATLARDVRADGRYVSFFGWDDMETVRGWKAHPEFKERMSRVQQFVDKFAPTELEVVARVRGEA
ncbi:MAG: antibiotic biosynthesis monooxygenase [Actinomycetota bacterium]|nr:antibiotic biosynthesis monooxygenase [Actinomycetota bacterium]